ncbi:MAG: ribosomal-processing cysteine protease Prp [Bacillota bacterium]|nr:ribosomal-processing cysteine protease Prp [Bacillota bacterium]
MVEITLFYDKERIKGFKADGHSGFAPEGEDICCAGVSAITQTALLGLLNHLDQEPEYKMEKGWIDCRLGETLSQDDWEKARIILSTMEMGLKSLQEVYPRYIKVQTGRC